MDLVSQAKKLDESYRDNNRIIGYVQDDWVKFLAECMNKMDLACDILAEVDAALASFSGAVITSDTIQARLLFELTETVSKAYYPLCKMTDNAVFISRVVDTYFNDGKENK